VPTRTKEMKKTAEEEAAVEKSNRRGDRNESQTVLRACEVLKSFRSLGEELSLTGVMERTQLPKTTVSGYCGR
jgi:hypothetical protein